MQVDLKHIQNNIDEYKVCMNCENINYIGNFVCVVCKNSSFKTLTTKEISERIEEDGLHTIIQVR